MKTNLISFPTVNTPNRFPAGHVASTLTFPEPLPEPKDGLEALRQMAAEDNKKSKSGNWLDDYLERNQTRLSPEREAAIEASSRRSLNKFYEAMSKSKNRA